MACEAKILKRGGGAYSKSGGSSTLMPRLPALYLCFLLFVARLASSLSLLPAGSLLGCWVGGLLAGCYMASLRAGASWLAAWLLTGWLAAGLAGCCWLLGWVLRQVGGLALCWAAGCLAGSRPTLPLLFVGFASFLDPLSLH